MTGITDGMYKTIFMMGIFTILMGIFSSLFVYSVLEDESDENDDIEIGDVVGSSMDVFSEYPELMIFSILFALVGIVISLIVIRELLPV